MTVQDVHDLIRILEEHPEWRVHLQKVLLTEELLELPSIVRELVQVVRQHSEILARHSEAIERLIEAQRRTDERLEQLTEAQRELAESQRRLSEEFAAYRVQTDQALRELAESQRRLSEEFAAYRVQTDQALRELAESQRRLSEEFAAYRVQTDQALRELAESQRRLSEEFAAYRVQTDQALRELAEALRRTQEELQRLVEWQRGEAGRREGEQYEQYTVRRALAIFGKGKGGSPTNPHVLEQLVQWLSPLLEGDEVLDANRDPSLADIIWWKGDEVIVVEVSRKVDRRDVERARQRCDTLRSLGVQALPAVIGEEWAAYDTQALAQQEGVEWMVAGSMSQGFLRFRRLPTE